MAEGGGIIQAKVVKKQVIVEEMDDSKIKEFEKRIQSEKEEIRKRVMIERQNIEM